MNEQEARDAVLAAAGNLPPSPRRYRAPCFCTTGGPCVHEVYWSTIDAALNDYRTAVIAGLPCYREHEGLDLRLGRLCGNHQQPCPPCTARQVQEAT